MLRTCHDSLVICLLMCIYGLNDHRMGQDKMVTSSRHRKLSFLFLTCEAEMISRMKPTAKGHKMDSKVHSGVLKPSLLEI